MNKSLLMKNKKSIGLFILFLLPLLSSAFVYPTFEQTLSNGLKVIVCEKPGNGFAEFEVWYRVGSKDEHPGIRGMAHMFEHMMFRGTDRVPPEAHARLLKEVGGVTNAFTTEDLTGYHD